jgi:hypothetical protein
MRFFVTAAIVSMLSLMGAMPQQVEAPGMIHGTVVDEVTQRPIPGVRIQIPKLRRQVFTDSLGNYRIDSLAARNFDVQAEGIGYLREIREVELPYPPHTICSVPCPPWQPVEVLSFRMRRKPQPLF